MLEALLSYKTGAFTGCLQHSFHNLTLTMARPLLLLQVLCCLAVVGINGQLQQERFPTLFAGQFQTPRFVQRGPQMVTGFVGPLNQNQLMGSQSQVQKIVVPMRIVNGQQQMEIDLNRLPKTIQAQLLRQQQQRQQQQRQQQLMLAQIQHQKLRQEQQRLQMQQQIANHQPVLPSATVVNAMPSLQATGNQIAPTNQFNNNNVKINPQQLQEGQNQQVFQGAQNQQQFQGAQNQQQFQGAQNQQQFQGAQNQQQFHGAQNQQGQQQQFRGVPNEEFQRPQNQQFQRPQNQQFQGQQNQQFQGQQNQQFQGQQNQQFQGQQNQQLQGQQNQQFQGQQNQQFREQQNQQFREQQNQPFQGPQNQQFQRPQNQQFQRPQNQQFQGQQNQQFQEQNQQLQGPQNQQFQGPQNQQFQEPQNQQFQRPQNQQFQGPQNQQNFQRPQNQQEFQRPQNQQEFQRPQDQQQIIPQQQIQNNFLRQQQPQDINAVQQQQQQFGNNLMQSNSFSENEQLLKQQAQFSQFNGQDPNTDSRFNQFNDFLQQAKPMNSMQRPSIEFGGFIPLTTPNPSIAMSTINDISNEISSQPSFIIAVTPSSTNSPDTESTIQEIAHSSKQVAFTSDSKPDFTVGLNNIDTVVPSTALPPVSTSSSPFKTSIFTKTIPFITSQKPRRVKVGCEGGLGFCDVNDNYPNNRVAFLTSKCRDLISKMFVPLPDSFEETSNVSASVRQDEACSSEKRFLKPGFAVDDHGKWQVVIQTQEISQRVIIEMCRTPQHSCSGLTDTNTRSRCVQKFSFQLLMALDPERPDDCPAMRAVRVPTSCSCQIEAPRISI